MNVRTTNQFITFDTHTSMQKIGTTVDMFYGNESAKISSADN